MNEEMIALAQRLIDCPGFRWMPGMRWVHTQIPRRGEGPSSARVRDRRPRHGRDVPVTVLPDLTDPATLGCLVALVREAWGDSGFYVAQSGTKIKGTEIFGWDTLGYLHGKSCKGMLYRSEAEALVAALEAAQ